jgi:hypothetical protein
LVIPFSIAFFTILGHVIKPGEFASPLEYGWIIGALAGVF